MNTTPPLRPVAPAAPLRLLRCARHPDREAAAKCPSCGQPCCRECTTEHEGRLLCASCFARAARPVAVARPQRNFAPLGRALLTTAAFLALWIGFHLLGGVLARIPTDFHEATIWAKP